MILVGLAGHKRAGKSTVARMLVDEHGFREVSFAAPLYRALAAMLRTDIAALQHDKERAIEWLGRSPRYLLQTLGTEWGRDLVRPDLWLLLASREIERIAALGGERIVISDVRYDNEARFVVERGGQIWQIWRPQARAQDAHASERGISESWSARGILNDGSLEELRERVRHLVAQLSRTHTDERRAHNAVTPETRA